MNLSGTLAVVTGSASGIGKATAEILAELGAVVVAADLNAEGADDTASAIRAKGGRALGQFLDVTDPESPVALARELESHPSDSTVVVNCVGWDISERFIDNVPEYWEKVVAINYLGPVRVTHALLPRMIDQGGGAIVNIASDAGRVGSAGETVYAGAKGGVIAFTKSLAREVARHGIRVNCVCPGPTDTPLFRAQPEGLQAALERAIPFRRLAAPREIGDAVAFFASSRSVFVTGQVLSVSGGLTMAG